MRRLGVMEDDDDQSDYVGIDIRYIEALGLFIAGFIILALIWSIGTATGAWAHQATPTASQPLGWQYPWSCCSGQDCGEVSDAFIREMKDGYEISIPAGGHPMVKDKLYRDLVPYGDGKIKDSPDGRFHACISQPCTATVCRQRTICLFVPPRNY